MNQWYKLLIMSALSILFSCESKKEQRFATDAPIRKIICSVAFPTDLIYQSSPDTAIILGRKRFEPAIFEISGFEILSGKKLWQLPFLGEIVGQTTKAILVYEAKTSTLHFVNPKDGETVRKIMPAPSPFASKNGLNAGMAFTDEMYLATKALYTQIIENGKIDTTWKIGITAKTWTDNKTKWFVPPVKQIIIIAYKPYIFQDKVLIINKKQTIDGGHSYQIISLKTGQELSRFTTEGEFIFFNERYFIEKTTSFIRSIEPFSGKEIWKIVGDFSHATINEMGNQISIILPEKNKIRAVLQVDASTGNSLKTIELPHLQNTILNGIYITKDKQIWLNFSNEPFKIREERAYDYWVAYDETSKKALWRTDFDSKSTSSLLPFCTNTCVLK